jgi:hypothetical protein
MSQAKQLFKKYLCAILIFICLSPLLEYEAKLFLSATIIIIIYYTKPGFEKIKKNYFAVALMTFLFLVCPIIVDLAVSYNVDYKSIIGFYLMLIMGWLLSRLITKEEFLISNYYLMTTVSIIGIPVFLLATYFGVIETLFPSYEVKGVHGGYSIGVVNFLSHDSGVANRFTAFGREPGAIQVFYLIALNFRLIISNGKLDIYCYLLIIALLLGKSTAGYVGLIIVLVAQMKLYKNINIYSLLFIVFLGGFIASQISLFIDYKLFGSAAFSDRYDRYSYLIDTPSINYIFGIGSVAYRDLIVQNIAGWDSFLQIIQRYGIFALISTIFLLLINNIKNPILSTIIFLSFFTQSMWFYPIISFFYFSVDFKNQKK